MIASQSQIEKLTGRRLPSEYKDILKTFTDFLIVKEKGKRKIFYLNPIKTLLDKESIGRGKSIYQFEKLKYLLKETSLTSGSVFCHSDNSAIDIERINNSIIIASYDGVYLYFDTLDNFSVWEFWIDDGSVGKLADNFKDFLDKYDIEVAE